MWNAITRGYDSTGYWTPSQGVIKDAKGAGKFILSRFNDIANDKSQSFIGHVRHATVGTIKAENAHPFRYGDIVMVHNGTLENYWSLCYEAGLNSADYDVDSQVMCALINKYRDNRVLSAYKGAAAVVFTNVTKPNIIYCYKDKERPLFRGIIKDEGIYISSSENALKAIDCENIKEFKDDYFYTIIDGVLQNSCVKIKKRVEKEVRNFPAKRDNIDTSQWTNYRCVPVKAMVGKWVMSKQNKIDNYFGYPVHITKGQWYFIMADVPGFAGKDDVLSVKFIGDDKKINYGNKFFFDLHNFELIYGEYCMTMDDLETKNKKGKVTATLKKGTTLLIQGFNSGKGRVEVKCLDEETDEKWNIPEKYLRRALEDEVIAYWGATEDEEEEVIIDNNKKDNKTVIKLTDKPDPILKWDNAPLDNYVEDIDKELDNIWDIYKLMHGLVTANNYTQEDIVQGLGMINNVIQSLSYRTYLEKRKAEKKSNETVLN